MEDSIVVSYDNITQLKADAQAARRELVLQQAFEVSINGITFFEAIREKMSAVISDFRLVMINEAGLRMSGYTRQELLGRTLWEIYPATGINGPFSRYVAVCETGQPYMGEVLVVIALFRYPFLLMNFLGEHGMLDGRWLLRGNFN
ncbi:PAS domain S-box protein [Spirosoma linguale]|uniref:Signal transduction histidine kinase regulating citrate/malate metabolism n=1 Tax=Spirosoma linguale (strain ATCC 33905 / DSM 74 / LMG 10896 / Claus 1) TaxID=504472 RepID=D2QC54_SPILD|nr:signal transduction histidine kinase regulating citrate/malate metabolism [Spirosoma linguale DSM 74]